MPCSNRNYAFEPSSVNVEDRLPLRARNDENALFSPNVENSLTLQKQCNGSAQHIRDDFIQKPTLLEADIYTKVGTNHS